MEKINLSFQGILGMILGAIIIFFAQYILGKVKNKIDFSEIQKERNAEFDKRLTVLEERTNKL